MCVCVSVGVCVAACVCVCVHVCETYINVQDVYVEVLFVFGVCVYFDPSLCVGAFSVKPALLLGHRMVTWRPSFALCVCVCVRRVCVCVSGCSQCVCVCVFSRA